MTELAERIIEYSHAWQSACYLEIGSKTGQYTPALSMKILPANSAGHVLVELDMEIDDTNDRSHRCLFNVASELGQIEQFGRQVQSLGSRQIPVGTSAILNIS